MVINIRLKNITPESTYEDRINALKATALEIQQLNELTELKHDPIKCNPDSEIEEGYLGNCNTPPTIFGDVSISILNYRWLELPEEIIPKTFSFVYGKPVREYTNLETGETITCQIGAFTFGDIDTQ